MKKSYMVNKLWLIVTIAAISCSPSQEQKSRVDTLPYYEEATFTPKWFENAAQVPADFHHIPSFSLLNQEGRTITATTLAGKIFVVDFFFTTCPGICPKMTNNMAIVQEAFLDDKEVMLLSHSVTPEYDSVSVLRSYAEKKGVVAGKWHLLTGERDHIYDLGRNYYFIEEDLGLEKGLDGFIHTENFVLIDGNLHIRGIYNGLSKTAINQLIADINTLKNNF